MFSFINNMINPIKNVTYICSNKTQIKSSRNPIELYKVMKMYSKERKEYFPFLKAAYYSIHTMLNNFKLRIVKDNSGNLLAAYTYKFKKNLLSEKSMYIDALVRNRTNLESKSLMPKIYQDMKNIAINKKAEEMTLFSGAMDTALRANYEKLGFKKDEAWISGGYMMNVKTPNFLET